MPGDFERGSQWRKWDLHIHSPLSLLNNQYPKLQGGEPDWQAFLQALESQDLAVIGITDYFTIDGYKRVKEFKHEGRLSAIHTVLPNVEFRLATIVDERRLNLHVIFSDEVPVADIEEHFLHDLHFYYESRPQDPDEKRKLKVSNLGLLGQKLIEQHENFKGHGGPVQVGAMHAVVSHEEIAQRLATDSRFKDKYLVVLTADGWDKINWDGQAHVVRKGLLQKSNMVFSSNQQQRLWCLGQPPYEGGEEAFLEEFQTLKPCIHGCDAHRLQEIGCPCAHRGLPKHKCDDGGDECDMRFCWIKADPTFEGLKQLLYEPEDRVVIGPEEPSPVISSLSLNRIAISGAVVNEDLAVADTEIDLNSQLVAVVGGKGTGKTALVDLVANCYTDRERTEDRNSFVRRIGDYRPAINTELEFRDGQRFRKSLGDGRFFDEAQIVYIAQGELETYIGVHSDLHQRIQDLILESDEVKHSVLSFEAQEAAKLRNALDKRLEAANRAVERHEQNTSEERVQAAARERSKIETDLADIEERLKELAKVQSERVREEAEERQERLGGLKARQKNLAALEELLVEIGDFLEGELRQFNESIAAAAELMRELEIEETLSKLAYPDEDTVGKVIDVVRRDIRETVTEIEKVQGEQAKMNREVKAHAKLLEKRGEFRAALDEIEKKENGLKIERKKLGAAVTERKEILVELLKSVIGQKRKYEEIIEAFAQNKDEILADIDFVAEIRFDSETLLNAAKGVLDNRKVDIGGDGTGGSEFEDLINLARTVADGDASEVENLVAETERLNAVLRGKTKAEPVTVGDLYDVLYHSYMTVVPVVKYKRTTLEKLSLGQKATVLIKIYLAHGDKPIIIDSHDDHLDNEFIMDELVRAIRRAKVNRQVILVSNNGNVVVNSDAEQIVVANRENGTISYLAGSLENSEIRERALRVLEGGEIAFKKRQEKYRVAS